MRPMPWRLRCVTRTRGASGRCSRPGRRRCRRRGDDRLAARPHRLQVPSTTDGRSRWPRLRAGGTDVHLLPPAGGGRGGTPAHPSGSARGRARALWLRHGRGAAAVSQPHQGIRRRAQNRAGAAVGAERGGLCRVRGARGCQRAHARTGGRAQDRGAADRRDARPPGSSREHGGCGGAGAGRQRRERGLRRPGGPRLPSGRGHALAQSGGSRYTFHRGTDSPCPAGCGAGVTALAETAERVTSGAAGADEEAVERAIRPRRLAEYVGQAPVKAQLEIFVSAARARAEALDHVLIFGTPGLGKTTLAHIIAHELGVNLRQTSGPVLERPGDLAALLTNLQARDVLFVDEIHRLAPVVEEVLYPAMEDYQLDIMIGEGPAARSIKLNLPPFTLVGATTRAGLLTSPLRDRFGIVQRLEFYTVEDLESIVKRSAAILDVSIEEEGARRIAQRSRGTPRIANRLLRRVRDFAQVRADGRITATVADAALDLLEVDIQGFDTLDRKLLTAIIERFEGGPVGIDSLAAALGEERGTLEDVTEPFLIQQGFLVRTARGRMVTRASYLHFGLQPPERAAGNLQLFEDPR